MLLADVAEYEQLAETVRALQAAAPPEGLRAQVDLGCNIFCQAEASVLCRGCPPPNNIN